MIPFGPSYYRQHMKAVEHTLHTLRHLNTIRHCHSYMSGEWHLSVNGQWWNWYLDSLMEKAGKVEARLYPEDPEERKRIRLMSAIFHTHKTRTMYFYSKNTLYLQGIPFTQVFPLFPFTHFWLIPIPTKCISGHAHEWNHTGQRIAG